jgi:hypothetical protein
MLEAVATGCPDYDRCWRPTPTPDGFPFASPELAALWVALLVLTIFLLLHRLGRD